MHHPLRGFLSRIKNSEKALRYQVKLKVWARSQTLRLRASYRKFLLDSRFEMNCSVWNLKVWIKFYQNHSSNLLLVSDSNLSWKEVEEEALPGRTLHLEQNFWTYSLRKLFENLLRFPAVESCFFYKTRFRRRQGYRWPAIGARKLLPASSYAASVWRDRWNPKGDFWLRKLIVIWLSNLKRV